MRRGRAIENVVAAVCLSLGLSCLAGTAPAPPAPPAEPAPRVSFAVASGPLAGLFFVDAQTLATIDSKGAVSLRESGGGTPIKELRPASRGQIEAFDVSGDGQTLACSNGRGQIDILDLSQRRQRGTLNFSSVGSIALSPDGTRLIGFSEEARGLRIVDVASGKPLATASPAGCNRLFSVAWSPTVPRVVCMWDRSAGLVWLDAATLAEQKPTLPQTSSTMLAFLSDGSAVLTAIQQPDNRSILALDAQSGRKLWAAPLSQAARRFNLSRNGKRLAAISGETPAVAVRDTRNGRLVLTTRNLNPPGQLIDVALSPEGDVVAAEVLTAKSNLPEERSKDRLYLELFDVPGAPARQ